MLQCSSREGGLPDPGGVLPGLGGSAWSEGVSTWFGGGLPGPREGVCLVPVGGSAWSGGLPRDPPLWTESQTRVKT